ncbi:hypothetical protein [Streptomyces sp. GC420]|uniref:hypothetical protein n=1 Tax=Streptomyces sp. GC420 TaxID=2697568 RepID=UPI00141520CA|nr:hypothetical protein [Streptomyces sp. GC420]NBM21070.1 hypothetical protein [Streptomyces sp. GC420]
MGIESDKLVYDYLSRVGDLAQQQQLPSGERMRLVAELRGEIDRRRAGGGADNPAAVNRILRGLGSPAQVVEAAADGGAQVPAARAGSEAAPEAAPGSGPGPETRARAQAARPSVPQQRNGALPPPVVEAGDEAADDWWSVEARPPARRGAVFGFTGGIEIPEMLRPPRGPGEAAGNAGAEKAPGEGTAQGEGTAAAAGKPRPWWAVLRRPPQPAPAPAAPPAAPATGRPRYAYNPVLVLAAALLVGGAVLGSWFPLAAGWLLAYASRRLTPVEAKTAVLGIPGAVAACGMLWFWGRVNERWGEPIAEDRLGAAVSDAWPVLLRTAAVASALFLLWRARRKRA